MPDAKIIVDTSCSAISSPSHTYSAIGDYAVIGDCHGAALIARTGSLDWLCLPDFSSPSLFAALLDSERGGCLRIQPRDTVRIERRYSGRSAVLETTFYCRRGRLKVRDFMAMPAAENERRLLRLMECDDGEIELYLLCQPAPDYARVQAQLRGDAARGWTQHHSGGSTLLESDIPLQLNTAGDRLGGTCRLQQGESRCITLCYAKNGNQPSSLLAQSRTLLRETLAWWNKWCSRCSYDGPYVEAVMRSCLTLKLLTHPTTGAVMAAATTSLPESFDCGARNWDYRYCWLRDTSLLLQSFLHMGFKKESQQFLKWLLRVGRKPRLLPLYHLNGDLAAEETELTHLEGYRGLSPVRIGNSARGQLQLDIYGEILATAYCYVCAGGSLSKAEQQMLVTLGDAVCRLWREPDQGIWETRGPPRHHTYSKLMCWVALDRLLILNERLGFGLDVNAFVDERAAIRHAIDTHGYDSAIGSYVGYFGGGDADASLLLMPRYGYIDAADCRALGTYRYIVDKLSVDGLLFRYPQGGDYDGIAGSENLFAVCNFWAVDFLARAGAIHQAEQLFERLLALANDVGLYAEQFDLRTGDACGNFPQAFSHAGLVTAALVLEQMRTHRREKRISP